MAKKETLTFEQELEKLEQIVASIESGQVGLEESIRLYAEGMERIKRCRAVLDSAEKKIQMLTHGQGEALEPAGTLEEPDEAQA